MKKIILAAFVIGISLNLMAASPINVTKKVLAAFTTTFPQASNVNWTLHEDYYIVTFVQNDIRTNIAYDQEGSIVRSLRYYTQEQLPFIVLSTVKETYQGKKIFGVTEESSQNGTIYHIILQDDQSWYHVNATPTGSLQLENKFKKA